MASGPITNLPRNYNLGLPVLSRSGLLPCLAAFGHAHLVRHRPVGRAGLGSRWLRRIGMKTRAPTALARRDASFPARFQDVRNCESPRFWRFMELFMAAAVGHARATEIRHRLFKAWPLGCVAFGLGHRKVSAFPARACKCFPGVIGAISLPLWTHDLSPRTQPAILMNCR